MDVQKSTLSILLYYLPALVLIVLRNSPLGNILSGQWKIFFIFVCLSNVNVLGRVRKVEVRVSRDNTRRLTTFVRLISGWCLKHRFVLVKLIV